MENFEEGVYSRIKHVCGENNSNKTKVDELVVKIMLDTTELDKFIEERKRQKAKINTKEEKEYSYLVKLRSEKPIKVFKTEAIFNMNDVEYIEANPEVFDISVVGDSKFIRMRRKRQRENNLC